LTGYRVMHNLMDWKSETTGRKQI